MRGIILIGSIGLLIACALPVGYAVYRIPIQVSEVADIVHYVDATPDVATAFAVGLRASRTTLRPLRQAYTKLLLLAAGGLGGRYHLTFRGTHVVLVSVLLALFVAAAKPRNPVDLAALAVGLSVLTGLHTFLGMTREAYPVNHFLVVAICAIAVLVLARSAGGWAPDIGAAAIAIVALLTLESGVLVVVVALAASACGLRGISRRGLLLMVGLAALYAAARLYLGIEAPALGERPTGFGTGLLSGDEQRARFGERPWALYSYTSIASLLSVAFSQPREGIWTVAARLQQTGALAPSIVVHVVSSAIATGLIVLAWARAGGSGRLREREPLIFVGGVVLVANAALSFSYAKDEVVSVAGVFYALAAYAAVRRLLAGPGRIVHALVVATALMWSVRVAGNYYILREQAFQARNDWVYVKLDAGGRPFPAAVQRLSGEASKVETLTPRLVDPRIPRWLGER